MRSVHGNLNYHNKEDITLLRQILDQYKNTRHHITENWNRYIFKQLVIHSNSVHSPSDSNAFLMERENGKFTLFAGLITS